MTQLTNEYIARDLTSPMDSFGNLLFTIAGFGIPLIPLLKADITSIEDLLNLIFIVSILFVCFGLGFGVFFGLAPIIQKRRNISAIRKGNFLLERDRVIDMKLDLMTDDDEVDNYSMLKFSEYRDRKSPWKRVPRALYDKTMVGDEFYMIYSKDKHKFIAMYATKEFVR